MAMRRLPIRKRVDALGNCWKSKQSTTTPFRCSTRKEKMQEKLLRTIHCEYQPAMYLGANFSGWSPIGDYVLVRPDDVARQTSGGIELPDDLADRMQLAAITGAFLECGD